MSAYFAQIEDSDEVRQGDIIRKLVPATGQTECLGIVITADCDIAQKKASGRYTWLEILPMAAYIEGPLAQEQLRKLAEKRARGVCEHLNAQIRKLQPDLAPLTHDSLARWLQNKTAEEVMASATGLASVPDSQEFKNLKAFALTATVAGDQTAFSRLKTAWTLLGTHEKAQQETLRNALKDGGGFQDYFVLPELPKQTDVGFVVMLRSMQTIMASDLFLTEQDARINDCPDGFHRIGRLNDGIRYSITQKLAFLFSRIGMPKSFEQACEVATELVVEEIFRNN